MVRQLLFLILLLAPVFPASHLNAQPGPADPPAIEHIRYLVLDRKWPVKRYRFYPGQYFMFKLKDEPGWHKGHIQAVHKNHLTVLNASIHFSEIRKVRLKNRGYLAGFAANTSGSLLGGGVVCILAGSINAIENKNGEKATIAIAGAGAVVAGSALRLISRRTIRVGGNYRLRSI